MSTPSTPAPSSIDIDTLTGYAPSSSLPVETGQEDKEPTKNQPKILMEIAESNIDVLFKDQHNEGFASVRINSHCEVVHLISNKFKWLLTKLLNDNTGNFANPESLNIVVNLLQSKAEFGDIRYTLSLRVAEYDGDLYYDLTNEKHQSIKISQNGNWQVIDKTPIPLFKRYNQILQTLPFADSLSDGEQDPLEIFISNLTNIKDEETKLIVKVILISWFIPDIPHIILIVHGGKGSAKSMFLTLIKSIVDPAKPSLLTIHDDKSEFIQQLAHNYLTAYDNLKYNPKWLSDECCKAVTGIGQTKRLLYTVDGDKIFEYKHCLMFNGINRAFSEPDILDRSIPIELSEIKPKYRRTEKEILGDFHKLKPKILKYIFDILAKAITIKKDIDILTPPRMADSAIWGESISRAMGNKENEFLNAYNNNIKFQNSEVIDSNPVAYAIRKFVEHVMANTDDSSNSDHGSNKTIFTGTPDELLKRLEEITPEHKINTSSREWPKDHRWLVRRLNVIKTNLQDELDINIKIERDSKNTSVVKIEKNVSDDSGENKISPENESLSPYLEDLSPAKEKLSPEDPEVSSTESMETGDIGDNGDISNIIEKEVDNTKAEAEVTDNIPPDNQHVASNISLDAKDNEYTSNTLEMKPENNADTREAPSSTVVAEMIGYTEPFFYCKQHPKVQNIHKEEIERHILYSTEHQAS